MFNKIICFYLIFIILTNIFKVHYAHTIINTKTDNDEPKYRPEHYVRSEDSKFVRFIISNLIRFPKEVFNDFPNVTKIDLSDCGVENIKLSDFIDGKKLKILNLSRNRIKSLSSETFVFLANLEKLYLNENYLMVLTSEVFRGLRQLNGLYLQDNNIKVIFGDAFSPLTELIEIDLSNNDIDLIPSDLFAYNVKLEEILLRNCHIHHVSQDAFTHLSNLRKFHIEYNSFPELHLPSLDELYADNSNIRELFINGSVRILSARNNILNVVEIENLTIIEELNLENNLLNDITYLKSAKKLRKLNLSMNQIDAVHLQPELFSNMTKLARLNLSHLNITVLQPGIFSNLNHLKSLDLSGNDVSFSDLKVLASLPRLRELDLRGNSVLKNGLEALRAVGISAKVYGYR